VPTRPTAVRATIGPNGNARSRGTTTDTEVALRSRRGDVLLADDIGSLRLRLRGRWRQLDRGAIPSFAWRRDGLAFAFARTYLPTSELPARLVLARVDGRRVRLRTLAVDVCGISPAAPPD
jgi:hypothetical protein